MIPFDEWTEITTDKIDRHTLKILLADDEKFAQAVSDTVAVVPDHFIDPDYVANILERLGKTAAASKLRSKLPQTKKIRSGDLGEILAYEVIEANSTFEIPIKRLRWKDHREMPMRGDDIIGILSRGIGKRPIFLKAEAKSRAKLSANVIDDARTALDSEDGFPTPHALSFVSDRLRETGNDELADIIDDSQWKFGISKSNVRHVTFTFSGNDPTKYQQAMLENYHGDIRQAAISLRINHHQDFITEVFENLMNGGDD